MNLPNYLIQDANTYRANIDGSIALLRSPGISNTLSGGDAGEDYEVSAWSAISLVDGLVYAFRAHVDNIGPCNITHSATSYDIKLGSGEDPKASQLVAGNLYFVRRDSTVLVVLNPSAVPVYSEFNYIVNPEFAIWQRGAASNNDDTYHHDRWYLLSDGNNIVQVSTKVYGDPTPGFFAPGSTHGVQFFSGGGADAKFGYAQIVRANDCANLRGSTCSLSLTIQGSGLSGTGCRAAVIEWQGTADSVTSDVVSSWNSTGTNPTLIANASYANTPSYLINGLNKIENVSISSSMNNIIIFIWSESTTISIGNFLIFSQVKLQPGPVCTPFVNSKRFFGEEVRLCQLSYRKSYNLSTAPGSTTDLGSISIRAASTNSKIAGLQDRFPPMWGTPTITWYNPTTGTSGQIRNNSGTNHTVSSTDYTSDSTTGVPTVSSGPSDGNELYAHWTAENEL